MTLSLLRGGSILATLSLAVLSACVPRAAPPPPAPAPMPAPTPTPAPAPPPAPAPSFDDWMDAPQTPGDWFYLSTPAYTYSVFGPNSADYLFVLRCDRPNRAVSLGRVSRQTASQPMKVTTETAERLLTAAPRQDTTRPVLAAQLSASDPLLDAMAISKGRFRVQTAGEQTLYLPSWPEVTRVIEDCR